MLSTSASYQLLTRDLAGTLSRTAASPVVTRETAYYRENISKVKSVDDFLGDSRLFAFAMKAFGLEEMTYAKAFIRKVLEEGTDDPHSFANTLADRRYTEFAEVFNFARYGTTTTAFDRTQQGTVDRYLRQNLEEAAGLDNEGIRLALYFERRASEINSPLDILADKALLTVAQTALGISAATAALDIDKQAIQLAARLDVSDLKDADKLAAFLNRFTVLWDVNNPQGTTQIPNLLISQPTEFGINSNLLASLQSLKTRGR